MSIQRVLAALAAASLMGVAGCDTYDPQLRAGVWHPLHTNRANLTMMAANPADLVRGTGTRSTDGVLAAAAVQRLHDNKVKKLPEAGISEIRTTGQGSAQE